jgi:uncharacterized protein YndB with AHSA1/START domain
MTPSPTGQVLSTARGPDLVLTRTFEAGIDDVWASITESERTARWFASWTGDPGPGKTIRYKLTFEGEAPEADMTIDACEPPRHLAVSAHNDYGTWQLEARLVESEGVTEMTFIQHLDDGTDLGSIGPGWEYYLDNLVASRAGDPPPNFEDYYPAQQAYYEGLA